MGNKIITHYNQHAARYQKQYDSVSAEDVHAEWRELLAQITPGQALDVGAGSGRDAKWLAMQGWAVTAIEPALGLREIGKQSTGPGVLWLASSLPKLIGVTQPLEFNLILLSAIWMHLQPKERPFAFQRLTELLSEAGMMVITLRFGPSESERPMYPVNIEELDQLAQKNGLKLKELSNVCSEDLLNRELVRWKTVVISREQG